MRAFLYEDQYHHRSYKTRAYVDTDAGAILTVTNKLESTYTYLDYPSQGPVQYVVMAAKDRLDCWASVYGNDLPAHHLPSGAPTANCVAPYIPPCIVQTSHRRCGCPLCCPTSPIRAGPSTTAALCGRSSQQPSGCGSSIRTSVRRLTTSKVPQPQPQLPGYGHYEGEYSFYVRSNDSAPLSLVMWGTNLLEEAHYDHYVVEYTRWVPGTVDRSVFELPHMCNVRCLAWYSCVDDVKPCALLIRHYGHRGVFGYILVWQTTAPPCHS